MADYDCDLFVIGAGSGGVRAARLVAMTGARVTVAEEYRVGGTCVIRGCVPKKLMVYASDFKREFEIARGYGWTDCDPTFDWKAFRMAKDREISRLSGIYSSNLAMAGADILLGTARFLDPHTLEVKGDEGTRKVTAEKVLIAAGDRPTVADFSMIAYLSYPNDETGYDLAASHPAVHAWLRRVADLPGWRSPYDLLPGKRLTHYAQVH